MELLPMLPLSYPLTRYFLRFIIWSVTSFRLCVYIIQAEDCFFIVRIGNKLQFFLQNKIYWFNAIRTPPLEKILLIRSRGIRLRILVWLSRTPRRQRRPAKLKISGNFFAVSKWTRKMMSHFWSCEIAYFSDWTIHVTFLDSVLLCYFIR